MRKENETFSLWQRFGALILSAVMVLGMLPATGSAETGTGTGTAGVIDTWTDPETLTRPQTIYGDNTLNAGKVTVGKSVSDSAITVDGKTVSLTGENNFLITMSQSAQVVGLAAQSKVPVDVVFVLDTSGSMKDNSRATTMVTAANTAIATLMAANDQNRIAVVAFSSKGEYGGGTSGGAAANVLSSLAHYDGDAATNHLQWVTSQGDTTGSGKDYIAGRDPATITVGNGWYQTTKNVNAFRHGRNGGTNIQAGITVGAQLLTAVTNTTYTDPDTNQTVTRIPFLIVLSDGQPTFSYTDEEWYAAEASSSEQGPGSSAYEGNGFLTALTAAYYKGLITEHYYGEKANAENRCFVYTMGVQIDSLSGDEKNLAQITLDPATYTTGDYSANGANSYWNYGNTANDNTKNAYYGWEYYWNSFLAEPAADFGIRVNSGSSQWLWTGEGEPEEYYTMQEPDWDDYNSWADYREAVEEYNAWLEWRDANFTEIPGQHYTVTADSITAAKKYVNGVGYTGGLAYNDEYYNASEVSQLEDIFKSLVATIQQKAISAPTRVSSGDHNFDGYVTFTDPLGEYMELKDMKGIIADGYFYQGVSAAQYLQTAGNAEFEQLILEVLETRMGMTASTHITAAQLLAAARASENQAYYKSATDYDNSIVWWGKTYHSGEEDTGMQVLGAADNDTIDYITSATNIPEGAEFVCRSYFYYGEAGGANANPDHQYLYFVVRVQRSLTAPYQQTVVVSAPASLLSMEKVLITESYDEDGETKVYTAAVEEETPLRVVYEVGLWDNITAENVSAVVSSDYAAEAPKDGKGQANVELNEQDQEVYHFFTNDWDRNQSQGSHHRAQTKVTFDAAADNAFYTYQQDTLLVDANGDLITAQPKAGDVVYYVREYYDWTNATKNEDGTYTAELKTELIAVTVPDDTTFPVNEDGQYYIPKGTYTAATLIVNGDDTEKEPNETDTSEIVAHPHRTGETDNSHYTVYLGNNGVISLVSDPPVPEKTVANVTQEIVDADGKTVMVGDVLTYTIKAENYSDKTATIIVTDTVPAGTELVAGSISDGGTVVDGKITWTLPNMGSGAVKEVSFQVKVTEDSLNNAIVISAITNQATVQIGENGPAYDSNITTNPPEGKKVTDTDGTAVDGDVQVGDILLFSIEFHNDADTAADITITDIIPTGTTFISADHNGTLSEDGKSVKWVISDVAPGAGGVVSFLVQVNADAEESIVNNASIQIGTNNPKQTNDTVTYVAEGNLVLKKLLAEGDTAEGKTFTLHLTESAGTLNGTYTMVSSVSGETTVTFEGGKVTVTIAAGETLTIYDLPAGAVITVTEAEKPGWTPSYSSGSVTIVANDTAPATVTVTNDYDTQPVNFQLKGTKTFTGDNFPEGTFTFKAQEYDYENGEVVENGIVVTATATYDGTTRTVTIDFSERTFTGPIDRYYLITEDDTTLPGVTTDKGKYLLHLVVKDNGQGQLVLTQTLQKWDGTQWVNADAVTFANTYAPKETSTTIGGVKTLTGRYLDASEFSFQLIDAATGKSIATATNTADSNTSGAFEFPAITYTEPGTYTYYVREVNAGAANTTYDATIYEVVVTVEDVNGQLVATQKIYQYVADAQGNYPEEGTEVNAIGYANKYNIQDTSVTLTGTKKLEGADLSAGQFSFTVYETDATGATKGEAVSVGMNNADGSITFAPIGFTAADMTDSVLTGGKYVKDFYFLVVEDIPAADGPTYDANMYYDPTQFVVKVTVTYDPESGSLTAGTPTVVAPTGEDAVVFENIKQPADVQIVPEGTKTTANAPDGVSFSFSVINTETGNEAAVGVGAANGEISFSTMSFSEEGTYTYWIVESNAGNTTNGITYDATRYLMVVEVTRDEYRKLHAAVTYYAAVDGKDGSTEVADYTVQLAEGTKPSFQNEYDAGGYINLSAKKSYNGTLHDGDFAFKLVRQDNGGEIDGIVKADGTVTFATMYYSLDDIPAGQDSAIIHYVMSEVVPTNAAMPGVTYDTKTYDVYVKITDNGDGTISAVLVDKDGNPLATDNTETTAYVETGITFTNVYKVATGTEVKIEADKTLTGRELQAGEFGFALYRYDGTEWKNIGTAFNTASGDISFIREYNADTLSHLADAFSDIDQDGKEEYVVLYRIDEIDNNLGGVEYSGARYYVKVIIEHDEEKATYEVESVKYYTDAECTKEATSVVFANEYSTNDTHFTPVGTKVLLGAGGKTMDPAGFTFEVIEVDENGTPLKAGNNVSNKVVATGTSDSDGKVTFSAVHFADESQCDAVDCTDEGCTGTVHSHYYMIHEPDGTATGVTYSDQTYYVEVVIHDNGKGLLEVKSVTYYSDVFQTVIDDSAVVITNHYGPGYMNLTLELDKAFQTASGRSYEYKMTGSEFDFEVYADEACTQLVTTGTNGPSDENGVAEIIFGTITVDKAGTYTYYIKEVPRDGVTHIDTDTNVIKVVVTVTDDGYGNLTATYKYYDSQGQELTGSDRKFTNTYNPAGTKAELEINKALSGKNLNGEEFTFVLTDANGNPVATVTNGADGKAVITLVYDAVDMSGAEQDANGVYTKVFTYTLTESKTVENGADGTYTYDESVYTVTVTLTDNGSGKLNASVVVTKDGKAQDTIVFSNSYTPKEITEDLDTGIGAQKLIVDKNGNVLKRDDVVFTFEVKDLEGNVVATGTADASEADENGYIAIDFGSFTFETAGEYRYLITETVSTKSGYVLDTSIWCTHILVRYNADTGKLYVQDADVYTHLFSGDSHSDSGAQPQAETEPLFVNVYDTTDVNLTLTVDKTLTGRTLKNGEFSFTLYNADGTIAATGRNHTDGTVFFLLDYTLEDLDGATSKTFVYTVKEDKGSLGGVTYDESVYTVTVVVTDNGDGTLSAKVAGKTVTGTGTVDTGIEFVNTYNAAPVEVEFHAVKHMEGMPLSVAYTFQLLDSDGEVVATGTNKMDGSIVFAPELEFTAAGEYLYTMVEVKADQSGVTFDETSFDVKVIVTDDGNGNLLAEVVYSTADGIYDLPVFINIYTPAGTSAVIKADKDLTGRDLEKGEFSFVLKDSEGNEIETVTNAADGSVTFTAIPYDVVGTYTYTVEEVLPEDAVLNQDGTYTYNGVTYDRTVYTVTVEVTDPGYDGVLDHKITYSLNGTEVDAAIFTNTYNAKPVGVTLEGTKTLTGKDMTAGEFTFHLVRNGNVIVLTNDENGNINFPTLTFSTVGVYTYELYEVKGDNAGITYDETKYIVTVTVTDDLQGQLVADVKIELNGEEVDTIAFANTYKAEPVGVVLDGVKYLDGKPLNDGEFTFHLVGNGLTLVLTNDAAGNINFPTLVYSKVGTYTYELYEVKGENGGVTYDDTVYTVTITVTDDLLGKLHAEVTYTVDGEPRDAAIFTNAYKAEVVGVKLEGVKTLIGKDMTEGEFTFHLVRNGNVIVLTNDAEGNINFPTLVYSEAGTYTYELYEVAGTNAGITYDDTVYTVTVVVTDDYLGQLHAEVTYTVGNEDKEAADFTNTYTAESVGVVLEGNKTLTGKDMTAGEFTFHLVRNGNVVVLTNDENGNINFPTLVYSNAGVYTYELYEVKGDDDNMTYDDAVYTITVTVTDDLVGKLHATVTYSDTVVFENVYTPDAIDVILEGTKDLTGRDQKAGEFDFEVRDAEGNLYTTGTNKADGTITFDTMEIDGEMDVVLYVSEVKGSDNQIEYDDYVYRVKLVVTNVNGQLVAEVTYMDGAVIFYNEYEEPISPDTGDDTPLFLYTGLMAVSVLALAVLVGTKKKERRFF